MPLARWVYLSSLLRSIELYVCFCIILFFLIMALWKIGTTFIKFICKHFILFDISINIILRSFIATYKNVGFDHVSTTFLNSLIIPIVPY